MNPDASPSDQLLSQLRDIHTAPEAAFWPPAPGWWVLALLLLLLLVWMALKILARWRAQRRRVAWLQRLSALSSEFDPSTQPSHYLAAMNELLKIVAIRRRVSRDCATLRGDAWARFLSGHEEAGEFAPLSAGPYQRSPQFDPVALERAAGDWIRRHG